MHFLALTPEEQRERKLEQGRRSAARYRARRKQEELAIVTSHQTLQPAAGEMQSLR